MPIPKRSLNIVSNQSVSDQKMRIERVRQQTVTTDFRQKTKCRHCGLREMPSLSILEDRVVLFSPRRAAAPCRPPITQRVAQYLENTVGRAILESCATLWKASWC